MPPSDPRRDPVEFGAPIGSRVRFATIMSFAVIAVFVVVDLMAVFVWHVSAHTLLPMAITPLVLLIVFGAVCFFSSIRAYRVAPGELRVIRRRRETSFSLAGLISVEIDPQAMKWSLKIWGNDGLGVIAGRFRNRKLGRYEALVSDRARAVVLRWPERTLVVSPDRPLEFADAVRRHAGLRR